MNSVQTAYQTVSLIGMPGVGKSTTGVILAKLLGLEFSDTDLAIQAREGRTLQEIMEQGGHLEFRRIEEEVLLQVDMHQRVLATGGSVIYSPRIMARLGAAGPVVYLQADIATLEQRVAANPLRGIAKTGEQTFADVYAERTPLYERYATHTVNAVEGTADTVAARIARAIGRGR